MRSLEDDLEQLVDLDKHRIMSAEWRDTGRTQLSSLNEEWDELGAPMSEAALLIRALVADAPQEFESRVRKTAGWLSRKQIDEAFAQAPDGMPIL